MKALPWIIATAGIGVAVYVIFNAPSAQYAGTNEAAEDAANKTGAWGTKERITGTGRGMVGKLKEAAGKFTGDAEMQGEGLIDQADGAIRNTAGKAAHAVSGTLHDASKG